ncbi:O-methyltransferase [Prolixibacteraceae bacterium JC049]|nr:O-methyltransferase [Prolixibacteraceae bacterium JC049]
MTDTSELLEKYILEHIDDEDQLLKKLNRETHVKVLYSRMLSGHLQGKILSMLTQMVKPKNILELGTFTGYSALCLAKGLAEDGKLHTIEVNDELEEMAAKYFEASEYANQIVQHVGDATEIVPTIDEEFDLVFLDADKRLYSEHFDLIFPKVPVGGYIIADNTLWSGKVIEELHPNDEQTKAILAFNKKVKEDTRVETVILPFRDGMTVLHKVSD